MSCKNVCFCHSRVQELLMSAMILHCKVLSRVKQDTVTATYRLVPKEKTDPIKVNKIIQGMIETLKKSRRSVMVFLTTYTKI
jgi:uncharacterized membrane protein